ncbi:pyridoxal phosphate-dependent aminotransferase [Brachybacterium paraconglomeratum]|uniref:Alanine aminotransferase n=2 Tax=Brachybacterium TaxID=43668 RepID=A0A426SQG9_9MICO|nr:MULTISPECIES: pyridoxal phosphate-dependent aminotransferase [Brachybacterium]MCZ4325846.1 pyridoxal phosphate-dependent aminotransferase [Brachybacterium paraconglomeratum]MDV3294874.1 pyridoxal phosphate-dependent aminotransferase [Brachybacterium paraconglomeratum]RRR20403.1 pyridoxal phosphate-dependent aminotransferase [Brachybacterium paraconglomeratum]GAP79765.1 aspartate aminotransferase [Brachybacterium sp. SW0106-09]GLI32293.1 aminotransferase AlaT [Brachybacterium conglomeratum]
MIFTQSSKLRDVCYEIRGPVPAEAARMEAEGHKILKLNIGNPAPFGFEAPDEILVDMIRTLPTAQGYSDSKGIVSARRAVAQYYQTKGMPGMGLDDIYLGNGVSELIQMTCQALVDDGDEVLVPAPDYPLWTASIALAGGRAVHYRCDEEQQWWPDVSDIADKVTPRTKAIVVINPNNPTGAVYPEHVLREIVEVARKHGLMILADEIYDKILYDDAVHTHIAKLAPDLLTITFNGLSKAYRVAGFRAGWMALYGPKEHAASFIEGLDVLSNMRLCPNVPAQHVVATALGGYQSVNELLLPGGRLREQRDVAYEGLSAIDGVSVVKASGALYMFPRIDREMYRLEDDEQFAYDLLRSKKLLVNHGTGFNYPEPDHLRLVTLPQADVLADAVDRIADHLASIRR